MSKTQMKLATTVETLLRTITFERKDDARFRIDTVRGIFKLTSLGKRQLAKEIQDVLTTNAIVEQFGAWTCAEVEHPLYQLARVSDHRIDFVHKEGDAFPSIVLSKKKFFGPTLDAVDAAKPKPQNVATEADIRTEFNDSELLRLDALGHISIDGDDFNPNGFSLTFLRGTLTPKLTKPTSVPRGPIFDEEPDEDLLLPLDRVVVKAKPGEDLRDLSHDQLMARSCGHKDDEEEAEPPESWNGFEPGLELRSAFSMDEIGTLLTMGLVGPQAEQGHSIEYLRKQLNAGVKKEGLAPKGRKSKPAPKAKKAAPKVKKPAPKAKRAK